MNFIFIYLAKFYVTQGSLELTLQIEDDRHT